MNSSILIIGIGLMITATLTASVLINQQQELIDDNLSVVDDVLEQLDTQIQQLNITKEMYAKNDVKNK